MNFSNKKNKLDFEKKFTNGFNHGITLISKIPSHLQESTLFTINLLIENQPNNTHFKGIYHGLSRAIMQEKSRKMAQIKAIEQSQSQDKTLER